MLGYFQGLADSPLSTPPRAAFFVTKLLYHIMLMSIHR